MRRPCGNSRGKTSHLRRIFTEPTKAIFRLHTGIRRAASSVIIQLQTGKIALAGCLGTFGAMDYRLLLWPGPSKRRAHFGRVPKPCRPALRYLVREKGNRLPQPKTPYQGGCPISMIVKTRLPANSSGFSSQHHHHYSIRTHAHGGPQPCCSHMLKVPRHLKPTSPKPVVPGPLCIIMIVIISIPPHFFFLCAN
jgi:hypothetical protein